MRNLAPWFIITVGGLFVLFMVFSDSKITQIITRPSQDVGYINGEPVTYQEFSKIVENARENRVKQTGKDIDENQMDAFRDQVWDALVMQKLVEAKIKEYGIVVTDDEIRDALLGPNPPAVIKQYFIDSTGHFDRQKYLEALQNPKNREAVIQTEDLVRQQKYQQKLEDIVNNSVVVGENEIKRNFIDNNIKMYADYVFVNLVTIPDSVIKITDEDLRKYYEDHLETYKIEPQRQLRYVLFRIAASKEDSAAILKNLLSVVEKVKGDTSAFKTYVDVYSDQPYKVDTVAISEIPEPVANEIKKAKDGDVIGPKLTYEGYVVYKLIKKIKTKTPNVRASHILIDANLGDKKAKEEAYKIYKQLLKGADFAKLAKEKSADKGSAIRGGDLGWFGKGQMVKPFEEACFKGKVGKILKPVKTRYGYHIIKVTGKSYYKYVVEKIVNRIQPSGTTLDQIYNHASDFSYLAKKNDFDSEAKLMHYEIKETPPFKENATTIPGLGANSGLVHFAFDNDLGTVSDVYKVPAGYVVAIVSKVIEAGFKPLEKVKRNVEYWVKREKKRDKAFEIVKKIRERIGNGTDLMVAKEVYAKAIVSKAQNFTHGKAIPGIGIEPKLSEYALTAPLNKLSEPIKGNRGGYLFRVTDRTKFDSTSYSIQHNTIRDNLLQSKRARMYADWLKELKKNADIKDYRYKYFR
jgi:parvulin-like peptidyl-prolyl isomerase